MNHESCHPHNHCGCEKSHDCKWHRDWRIWAGVILMLIAMAIYLLTLDEQIVPGGQPPGNASTPAADANGR